MPLNDKSTVRTSYKSSPRSLTATFLLFTTEQLIGQLESGSISGTARGIVGSQINGTWSPRNIQP
jgi:hypothetical protein